MKRVYLFAIVLLSTTTVFSQNYQGYNTGNFTGVNSVFFNPANVADSRYRWDVNLFSIGADVATDYASLKTSKFFSVFKDNSNIDSFINRRNVSNANLLINADVFGPSVMFNLNKKSSLAITTRGRTMVNIDKIPDTLLHTLENDGENVTYPSNAKSDRFALTGNMWAEFGVTYGRVLVDEKKNYFKFGVTIKYLGGVGSGYFVSNNFNSGINQDILGNTYLEHGTGQMQFGSSGLTDNNVKLDISGSGVGGDIGFVYEYRPEKYGEYDADQYKLKAELSLLDVGSISYKHTPDDATYELNTSAGGGGDRLYLQQFEDVSSFSDLKTALKNSSPKIAQTDSATGKYSMSLPTSLTGAVDYNLAKKFYVNLGGMISLNKGGTKNEKTHTINYIMLTPRYESQKYGFYLPLSYNSISGFNAGISMRGGPFFVGSGSILSTLIGGKTQQVDVHFGIHVGVLKKQKKEKTPKVAEVKPEKIVDTDGDGVADKDDKCPAIAGLAKYNGCPIPDSDSDGVNDEEDKCPTVAGLAKYNGCPIPDTDGDGINDEVDKCPTEPGLARYQGCPIPDSDSDGVNDEVDKCPTIKGVARYDGCPVPDTDKDGINDEEDKCPTVPGPASNHGCPVIKKEIIQKVNFAAKNLQFQTGKAIILKKSYAQLDNVARILKADSSLNIEIDGHTDNVGDSLKNMKLSADRAEAAKTYFIKKGIAANRISTQGFGPTKPIAPNKTPQGRAKNRRVEFVLKNY